jgi:hypothetical protein
MQCEHAQEFISEYVTGEMDHALAVTLEHHLIVCAQCRDAVEGLRRLWDSLEQMPVVEPPPTFHMMVMDRIAEEQAQTKRAARLPMRLPSLRGLLQPRSLAYAAVTLVLLLSAELVQVQRAALGPLGLVLSVVHPVPLLKMQKVGWMPNGQGGGTLNVRLQAHAQANGAISRLLFKVQLDRKDGAISAEAKPVYVEGELSSEQPTVLNIPLTYTPSDAAEVLHVTLTSVEGAGEDKTIAIPLSPVP